MKRLLLFCQEIRGRARAFQCVFRGTRRVGKCLVELPRHAGKRGHLPGKFADLPAGVTGRGTGLTKGTRSRRTCRGRGLPGQSGRTGKLPGRGRSGPHGCRLLPRVGMHAAKTRTGGVHGGPEGRRQAGADIDG